MRESYTKGDVPATTSSANPGANTHEGRHPYVFHERELVNVNVGKAFHQAEIESIKNEMAPVGWKTWKGCAEVEVNQLRPICDGSKRRRKQMDQFGQLKPAATKKLKEPAATKKLKPAATAARLESAKIKHSQSASDGAVPEEMKPHLKNLCTFLCNVCHDSPISAYCAEMNLFFCNYCKVLENKKQACLARPESIKGWLEEEDTEESLVVSRVTAPTTVLLMKSVKDWDTFYPTAYTPIESPYQSEERDYSSDGSADKSYSLKGYSADGSADESYSLKGYSESTMERMLTRGQVKLSHAHETKIKHQSASDGAVPEEEGCWAGGWEDFCRSYQSRSYQTVTC